MAQVVFIGMDTKQIDEVLTVKTKIDFPDVRMAKVDNLGELAQRLDPRDSNIVVSHTSISSEEVLKALGSVTGILSSSINTSIPYDPSSNLNYAEILYEELSRML